MGIALNAVHLLSQTLALLGDLSDKKLLTLGVQDCHFTFEKIIQFLRRHRIPRKPITRAEVLLTTGFNMLPPVGQYQNCIHQNTFFRLLGFSPSNIRSMDVSQYEGADIVHDLNVPIDDSLASNFDLIFDGGTIEHVFSIKDALFNMCRMCKIGGIVVNWSPVDYINHGFINLNAEILRDCFLSNGFEETALKYIAIPRHPRRADQHYLEYRPDKRRFSLQPYYETAVYSAYRKVEERSLTVPLQGVYRKCDATGQVLTQRQSNGLRAILYQKLRDWVDAYYVSSVVVRDFMEIRRGKKVIL
jgi:hypothetical protein